MSIHIVTHCYAISLPQYASHLIYQLSSLITYKPEVPVRITVCHSFTDHRTVNVINWFRDSCPELNLHTLMLDNNHLFRRSIGRNFCSDGKEELTWFTDVDHVFGRDCLDSLWKIYESAQMNYDAISLLFPKQIQIHKDHATGDALIASEQQPRLVSVDPSDFTVKHYNRAIGGIQIVPRWYLTQYGYLRDMEKYQTPSPDKNKPFPCFRDDVVFRSQCAENGRILPIQLPNLYRLRHSKTTYQGQQHETLPLD